jgi:curved DNA-binding protein CbpA
MYPNKFNNGNMNTNVNNQYGQQYINGLSSLQHNSYAKQVNSRMNREMRPPTHPTSTNSTTTYQPRSGAYCNINERRPQFQEPTHRHQRNSQTNRVLPNRATPYNNGIQNEIYNTMMSQQAHEQNQQQMKLQEQERQTQYHQQKQNEQLREQQKELQKHQRLMYEEQQRQEKLGRESQQRRGRDRKLQNLTRNANTTSEMNPEKIKFRRELDEFVAEGNDPYNILELPEEFTFEHVKRSYKKKALHAHPDKGGSDIEFARITKAYLFLKEEFHKQTMQKQSHELKRDYKLEMDTMPKMKNRDLSGERFSVKKFNKIYDDYRMEDVNDEGYQNWMTERTDAREDIDIKDVFGDRYNKDVFNNAFEKQEIDSQHMQLIKIAEPAPMAISNRLKFTELGGSRPDDFTKTTNINANGGLGFYDYKTAHTQSKLVDTRNVKMRKKYKSVDDYEKDRSNQDFTETDGEIEYRKHRKYLKKKKERERRKRLDKNDNLTEKHFNKVNKLMLGGF